MDPTNEDCTMANSHLTKAIIATINSTALPKVALMRPARVCPTRLDSSSVANAKSLANGIMAKNENTKTIVSLFSLEFGRAKCKAQDRGINTSKTFSQDDLTMARRLLKNPGAGPTGLSGLNMTVFARAKVKEGRGGDEEGAGAEFARLAGSL